MTKNLERIIALSLGSALLLAGTCGVCYLFGMREGIRYQKQQTLYDLDVRHMKLLTEMNYCDESTAMYDSLRNEANSLEKTLQYLESQK